MYYYSLSKVAGERMTEGNPFVTDLSDPNRPQKLAEKFNSLYDNSWTDAFEGVSKGNDEQVICTLLLDTFKVCNSVFRLYQLNTVLLKIDARILS